MCTMTIHASEAFAEALRNYAERLGKSVNQTVQDLLAPTLGVSTASTVPENPFMACCGVVSAADGKKLRKAMAAQRGTALRDGFQFLSRQRKSHSH